jgi:GNAT superfamily N-acetyltransferase
MKKYGLLFLTLSMGAYTHTLVEKYTTLKNGEPVLLQQEVFSSSDDAARALLESAFENYKELPDCKSIKIYSTDEQQLMGIVIYQIVQEEDLIIVTIEYLVTALEQRNKGIAKLLLEEVALQTQCHRIILIPEEESMPFYFKAGFEGHEFRMHKDYKREEQNL